MSEAPGASTISRTRVPFACPFVPSSVFPGLRRGSVKRAPCRARCPARSRPEECHLRELAEFLGGRRINQALFEGVWTMRPRSSVAILSSPSCAPTFIGVSGGAFRFAEEAPAVALASGASLLPPSCDVLSDIVVDGHREVPVRAGKPAREGVVSSFPCGKLGTTRFICTPPGGYLTSCCGDEPDGRSSILSHEQLALPTGRPVSSLAGSFGDAVRPWPVGVASSSCPER